MQRPEHGEVAAVESGQLGLIESLHDSHHCRIDEPDVGIRVAVADGANPAVVSRDQILNEISAILNVVEERHECRGLEPPADLVIDLHEDRCWDQDRLDRRLDQVAAGAMVGIRTIKARV